MSQWMIILMVVVVAAVRGRSVNNETDPLVNIKRYIDVELNGDSQDGAGGPANLEADSVNKDLQRQTRICCNLPLQPLPREGTIDCKQLQANQPTSGIRQLTINDVEVEAYCDQDTDGGGWTVIQRRTNGRTFDRDWIDYENGFGFVGTVREDYWLGLKHIKALTAGGQYKLRIDVVDADGRAWYAVYNTFELSDPNYTLHVSGYSGTAGDALIPVHVGQQFSTYDRDNDRFETGSCADAYSSGWWFSYCAVCNLNGLWMPEEVSYAGAYWGPVSGDPPKALKSTSMKIKPRV